MNCKAELIILLDYILGEIRDSKTLEEAYHRILKIRSRFQEEIFYQISS